MKKSNVSSLALGLGALLIVVFSVSVWTLPKQSPQYGAKKNDNSVVTQIPDFAAITNVNEKKQAFFDFLAPIVKQQNAKIKAERVLVTQVIQQIKQNKTASQQQQQLSALFKKYHYQGQLNIQSLQGLLQRIDTIPTAMALVQAANESGWGSSRFAREGFNFFGQWCFSSGCGLVPLSRDKGKSHEVAVFNSVIASVAEYMRNLNSNAAYRLFRTMRSDLRSKSQPLTAEKLIPSLVNYSERKSEYVSELLDMLRHNKKYLVDIDV